MNCHPVFGCSGHSHTGNALELSNLLIKSITLSYIGESLLPVQDRLDELDIELARLDGIDTELGRLDTELGKIPLVNGKIPDTKVSTADGSTQNLKNTMFSLELSKQKLDTGITATAKFGGVERSLSDKLSELISINDFNIVGNGIINESAKLNKVASKLKVINLEGKVVLVDSLPTAKFVNGTIITSAGGQYIFGSLGFLEEDAFRLMTYNIGSSHVARGYYNGDRHSTQRIDELQNAIFKFRPHVVGLQEVYIYTGRINKEDYKFGLYNELENIVTVSGAGGFNYGNLTMSQIPITTKTGKVFDSPMLPDEVFPEPRGYVKTVHSFRGKKISVYNTHLALANSRILEMVNELYQATLTDNSDAIFIMGDCNTPTNGWYLFNKLTDNGFSRANNGQFDTNPSPTQTWYIDEIFYKGATLLRTDVYANVRVGDHSALFSDFIIL